MRTAIYQSIYIKINQNKGKNSHFIQIFDCFSLNFIYIFLIMGKFFSSILYLFGLFMQQLIQFTALQLISLFCNQTWINCILNSGKQDLLHCPLHWTPGPVTLQFHGKILSCQTENFQAEMPLESRFSPLQDCTAIFGKLFIRMQLLVDCRTEMQFI